MFLAELLYNHFTMINSRFNTFKGIIKSLILCRGGKYKNMAEEIEGDQLLDSKIKSVYRFFRDDPIHIENYQKYMQDFLPTNSNLTLILDRTTWEFGKEVRNILVLSASYDKIAMPVLYKIIPCKGNCTADDQIELIDKFIEKYGQKRIGVILGDREFNSEQLITYLHNKELKYVLRVKKSNKILNKQGNLVQIKNISEKAINYETEIYKIPIKFDHFHLKENEYLSVIYSKNLSHGAEIYRKRWDIETAFKGCKSNGFRMEDTHVTNKTHFECFVKCLFIAYAIAIKTGDIENQEKPIEIKKTLGCKAYSILQYGIRLIKQFHSKLKRNIDGLMIKLLKPYVFQPN